MTTGSWFRRREKRSRPFPSIPPNCPVEPAQASQVEPDAPTAESLTDAKSSGSSGCLPLSEICRFAFSDLRNSPLRLALTVLAIGIGAGLFLLLSFYGNGFYQYQREFVASGTPTLITAISPDFSRGDLRITEDVIHQITSRPEVALAFPKIELGVNLDLAGNRTYLTAEGTVGGDPRISQDHLEWFSRVRNPEISVAIIDLRTLTRLGGRLTSKGPVPDQAILRVGRTTGGKEETRDIPVRIAGITRRRDSERLFIPLDLAIRLDQFCSHKSASIDSAETGLALSYPHAVAYIPVAAEHRLADEVHRLGILARPLASVSIPGAASPRSGTELRAYQIMDGQSPDGSISDELLNVLRMTKPTFAAVIPVLEFEVEADGQHFLALSSSGEDPVQHSRELSAGTWSALDRANSIVVPHTLVPRRNADGALTNQIGRDIVVSVFKNQNGKQEKLDLVLHIAAITRDTRAFIPEELAKQLALWRNGQVLFNPGSGRFESPQANYEAEGHVRGNIVARDADSVEPLVWFLETQGYHTQNGLAEAKGLQQLGRALVAIVGFFSLGACLNAAATVLIACALAIRSKSWEIGLLKAFAFSNCQVLSIFLVQGLVIGSLGFILALVWVNLAEPFLIRPGMEAVFGAGVNRFIQGIVLDPQHIPLLAVTLAVSFLCSVCGILFPAISACRMSPVQALIRRD